MKDLGSNGGRREGENWSHPIFDVRHKTRGGGLPARYRQKRQRTAADRSMGHIVVGIRGCCMRTNGDGDCDSVGGDDEDGMGIGGSSCDTRKRSGLR